MFLLFAAALVIGLAFGATSAEASLPRVADAVAPDAAATHSPASRAVTRELVVDDALEHGPDPALRLGFAEELCLLEPDQAQAGFVLFERETRRCERTYARNNPLKYVDPDGNAPEEARSVFQRVREGVRDFFLPGATGVSRGTDERVQALHEAGASGIEIDGMLSHGDRINRELADVAGIAAGVGAEGAVAYGEGKLLTRVFESFGAFKRAFGPAGDRVHWHHIVEQTPSNAARFGASALQNLGNVVRVDAAVHMRVSAYYSSKTRFSNGLTVRQWLSTQSFEAQKRFGEQLLKLALGGSALPL